jgi:hypothetical protein
LKKIFLTITIFALFIFLSIGCVTKNVWRDEVISEPYSETIFSFYTNDKKDKIVFIGDKFHYIFDKNTEDFSKVLEAKELLKLSNDKLSIYSYIDRKDQRVIYTTVAIRFKKDELNSEQLSWIDSNIKDNYVKPPLGISGVHPKKSLESQNYFFRLVGKRYLAKRELNHRVAKLRLPLQLTITDFKRENKISLYKIAMTPLSLTADAGLIIVGTGVAIVLAPFALVSMAYKKIKD